MELKQKKVSTEVQKKQWWWWGKLKVKKEFGKLYETLQTFVMETITSGKMTTY